MSRLIRGVVAISVLLVCLHPSSALADHIPCGRGVCPHVENGPGVITASLVEQTAGGGWVASNAAPVEHPYTYRLSHPCVVDDRVSGACRPSDFRECPAEPGRVVEDLVMEQR